MTRGRSQQQRRSRRGGLAEARVRRQFARKAYHRQNGLCYWCGEPMNMVWTSESDPRGATADHVDPQYNKGRTTAANIVAACRECNLNRTAAETNRTKNAGGVVLSAGDDTPTSPFDVLNKINDWTK